MLHFWIVEPVIQHKIRSWGWCANMRKGIIFGREKRFI